jgi:hypothetical protein
MQGGCGFCQTSETVNGELKCVVFLILIFFNVLLIWVVVLWVLVYAIYLY